jgi:hypothetical protein
VKWFDTVPNHAVLLLARQWSKCLSPDVGNFEALREQCAGVAFVM